MSAAKGLRSAGELTRLLKAHVYPGVGGTAPFSASSRSDVARAPRRDRGRPRRHGRPTTFWRSCARIMNWCASRARRLCRADRQGACAAPTRRSAPAPACSATTRFARVWKAAEERRRVRGVHPPAAHDRPAARQGRRRCAGRTSPTDGTWTIPAEAREKGNAGELQAAGGGARSSFARSRGSATILMFSAGRSVKGESTHA